MYTYPYVYIYRVCLCVYTPSPAELIYYGVATISRLLKIIGKFRKRAL